MNIVFFLILPIKLNSRNFLDDCLPTSTDIQGPYYIANSPNTTILTPPEITSNFLFITGTVYANDCSTPIPNAVVDVWHSNRGTKDIKTNTFLNSSYETTYYRAKIYTDQNGNYAYQTILPGKYLNVNTYRPSHIHYKSSYLDQNEITTQLYFEGDTSIASDPWASSADAQNRIIPLNIDSNGNLNGVFDITLNTNAKDLQSIDIKEKRIIKGIHPNPITKKSVIYFDNTDTRYYLELCDINGQKIKKITNLNQKSIIIENLINIDILKKGIYIIKVGTSAGSVEAKRIVVN